MTIDGRIVIVGAGVAGLTCAHRLTEAGLDPLVLDKGRGIGGRLATRRAEGGLQFDHGAQYVTARSEGFGTLLGDAKQAGMGAYWDDGSGEQRFVGAPGMTALAKYLGRGITIRQNTEVSRIRRTTNGWSVTTPEGALDAAIVVVTAPAPQTVRLLDVGHPLAAELADVVLEPCLTLMAALAPAAPRPFASRLDPREPLAWIAQDSTKPGRAGQACWVAQAGADWSRTHLELARDDIAQLMVPMLCDRLGAKRSDVRYSSAHRWRYARVSQPLGRAFLSDEAGTFYAGGDWCLEARVEAAWTSGAAIAQSILDGF